jgi:hypothetical protein
MIGRRWKVKGIGARLTVKDRRKAFGARLTVKDRRKAFGAWLTVKDRRKVFGAWLTAKAIGARKNYIVYKRRGIYMGKFQDLKVWQRAKDLAVYIYKLTGKGDFTKDFSLKDQIRKAAVSMPSIIAEGNDLRTDKQAVNYFYIA